MADKTGRKVRQDEGCGLQSSVRIKPRKPSLYKVIMLNDDYTAMDFVVMILRDIFGKNEMDAMNIMMTIHKSGRGVCGEYSLEIAQTKVAEVHQSARRNGFPLRCVIEEV